MKRRNEARQRMRWMLVLLFALLFYHVWSAGFAGQFMRHQLNTWFLPRSFAEERVTLQRFVVDRPGAAVPLPEGVSLTISDAWMRSVLRASPYPSLLLPPGLLVDGLLGSGSFDVPQVDGSMLRIPMELRVRDEVGRVPHLHARFPADKLNRILDESFAEDWTEMGEYLLGSYHLEQRIRFDTLRIHTIDTGAKRPLYPIMLRAQATGRLRYRFLENWMRVTLTAQVAELSVTFVLIPVAHPDGIGFDYRARVDVLELQVKRLAPWIEERLAKAVRESLERSLNKRRKRERLARNRWPLWLPMALSVDIEILMPEY